jgi:hypothetical protein
MSLLDRLPRPIAPALAESSYLILGALVALLLVLS